MEKGLNEMTIRQLIAYLLQDNDLDSEIIVAYWDKNYFVDDLDIIDSPKVDKVWADFVKSAQETVNSHLEFSQTGYELTDTLIGMIE